MFVIILCISTYDDINVRASGGLAEAGGRWLRVLNYYGIAGCGIRFSVIQKPSQLLGGSEVKLAEELSMNRQRHYSPTDLSKLGLVRSRNEMELSRFYGSYNEPLRTDIWLYAEDHVPLVRVSTEDVKSRKSPNSVSAALRVESCPKVRNVPLNGGNQNLSQ
ncbi:hypothetical protein BDR03DRAFT_984517 [Suillus americanus]|nr:hypothetical protein BDR03DRAFT_984517 [Suillus americanus]